MRANQRPHDSMRPIQVLPHPTRYAEGSAEVHFGHTRVLVTASIQPGVPKWLSGQGWVTAEYSMLPRSTSTRIQRHKATEGGRSKELSRLIGRCLRSCVDLKGLGERQVLIDCDVLQADGGTRTAAITGGFVALGLALKYLVDQGQLTHYPLHHGVTAVSVGVSQTNELLLDLDYEEDSTIGSDVNFVFTHFGDLVEIQGTAEKNSFSSDQLLKMIELAKKGHEQILTVQKELLPFLHIWSCPN